jgi:hypothetical protein
MFVDIEALFLIVVVVLLIQLSKTRDAHMRTLRLALRMKYPDALIIEDFRMGKGGMFGWCKVSIGFKDGRRMLHTPEMKTPHAAIEAALNLR